MSGRVIRAASKMAAVCHFAIAQNAAVKSTSDHHNPAGGFRNPWASYRDVFKSWSGSASLAKTILRLQLMSTKNGADTVKPTFDFGGDSNVKPQDLKATWLGHATFLLELPKTANQKRGVRILLDPVFSQRVSPLSFAGPKRVQELPFSISDLPPVDLIVLSHNHYDHMDVQSLRQIYKAAPADAMRFFVPLENAKFLQDECKISRNEITECDWWHSHTVTAKLDDAPAQDIKITCTPAQHATKRSTSDDNVSLWASWVFEVDGYKIFFGGDSAYRTVTETSNIAHHEATNPACPAFKEIGQQFGSFDLAMIGIGAYAPRHIFSHVHASPEDAVHMHQDIRSRKTIGMHWGTFILTTETLDEPPRRLKAAAEAAGLAADEFTVGFSLISNKF